MFFLINSYRLMDFLVVMQAIFRRNLPTAALLFRETIAAPLSLLYLLDRRRDHKLIRTKRQ